MKVNKELLNAIAYLSKEKGVSADVICDSLEAVLITAYKKRARCQSQRRRRIKPLDWRL